MQKVEGPMKAAPASRSTIDRADPIQDLVRDFAAQLAGVTKAFQDRISQAAVATHDATGGPRIDLGLLAQTVLSKRRSRRSFFPADLFHEPAWDMLLALYVARREERAMHVKVLVAASDAPVTTSQRWIEHLHRLGLIERSVDAHDRRRVEVALSDAGESAMTRYLESLVTP
jgi:DNA-binding MarR family transcriptional regulator